MVATDEAATQQSITKIYNLPNTKYMADQWHLFDSILPLRFGKYYFKLLYPILKGVYHAILEEKFDECYNKDMRMLQQRESRNIDVEEKLEKFKMLKKSLIPLYHKHYRMLPFFSHVGRFFLILFCLRIYQLIFL